MDDIARIQKINFNDFFPLLSSPPLRLKKIMKNFMIKFFENQKIFRRRS
jgi:hypothetical protein